MVTQGLQYFDIMIPNPILSTFKLYNLFFKNLTQTIIFATVCEMFNEHTHTTRYLTRVVVVKIFFCSINTVILTGRRQGETK